MRSRLATYALRRLRFFAAKREKHLHGPVQSVWTPISFVLRGMRYLGSNREKIGRLTAATAWRLAEFDWLVTVADGALRTTRLSGEVYFVGRRTTVVFWLRSVALAIAWFNFFSSTADLRWSDECFERDVARRANKLTSINSRGATFRSSTIFRGGFGNRSRLDLSIGDCEVMTASAPVSSTDEAVAPVVNLTTADFNLRGSSTSDKYKSSTSRSGNFALLPNVGDWDAETELTRRCFWFLFEIYFLFVSAPFRKTYGET